MRMIRASGETEMIATFLRSEWQSERFGADLRQVVEARGGNSELVTDPDLSSAADNAARKDVLGEFRGYGRDERIFQGFPTEVRWDWVELDRSELMDIRYVRYSYWDEISRGTRLPGTAAEFVRDGGKVFGRMATDHFLVAAQEAQVRWPSWPPLIAVRPTSLDHLVLLEGHARLTIMALANHCILKANRVLLGTSAAIRDWSCY